MKNRVAVRWMVFRCLLSACILVSCHRNDRRVATAGNDSATRSAADAPIILLIGTSLTAGFGLDPDQAWPALLQRRIDSAGYHFRVINAGVSGETSADALHRMDWVLSQRQPAIVVVETGANDALRGQSLDSLRANLDQILTRLEQLNPRPAIVVAGMEALPNLGREYGAKFRAIFPELAAQHHAYYLPFLLRGVAGVDTLNQADGIHPNARGSVIVARNVWEGLREALDVRR